MRPRALGTFLDGGFSDHVLAPRTLDGAQSALDDLAIGDVLGRVVLTP